MLVSVRTNHDFTVEARNGVLVPLTEVIILVEKPDYKVEGDNIVRKSAIVESRFKADSNSLGELIQQLQLAHKNALHFDKVAGDLNSLIKQNPPPAGEAV